MLRRIGDGIYHVYTKSGPDLGYKLLYLIDGRSWRRSFASKPENRINKHNYNNEKMLLKFHDEYVEVSNAK